MQADADSVIHPCSIFLGFVVAQVCHFAMDQNACLPLVLAVAGPYPHVAAGALPAAETPSRHLQDNTRRLLPYAAYCCTTWGDEDGFGAGQEQ